MILLDKHIRNNEINIEFLIKLNKLSNLIIYIENLTRFVYYEEINNRRNIWFIY